MVEKNLEIEISKLDEQSKQNLDDWLSAIWNIFDELKQKSEDTKTD